MTKNGEWEWVEFELSEKNIEFLKKICPTQEKLDEYVNGLIEDVESGRLVFNRERKN